MMNIAFFVPLALGVTVVLQATLNRAIGHNHGLATAVLINAVVFFVLSLGFFLTGKYNPDLVPEFLRFRESSVPYSWYYLIPGACGFFLVLGLPYAIHHIGPSLSFLLLIASQVVVSLAFEIYLSGNVPSLLRLMGAALIVVGSILVIKV